MWSVRLKMFSKYLTLTKLKEASQNLLRLPNSDIILKTV